MLFGGHGANGRGRTTWSLKGSYGSKRDCLLVTSQWHTCFSRNVVASAFRLSFDYLAAALNIKSSFHASHTFGGASLCVADAQRCFAQVDSVDISKVSAQFKAASWMFGFSDDETCHRNEVGVQTLLGSCTVSAMFFWGRQPGSLL
jgi:hypothetical protein